MVGDSWRSMLLCAAGTEPFELVEHAVAVAGSMSGGAKPRIAKQLPASLDTFGWCTWDAYYSTVSAQGTICCISYATFFHVHASACMCTGMHMSQMLPGTLQLELQVHVLRIAACKHEVHSNTYC